MLISAWITAVVEETEVWEKLAKGRYKITERPPIMDFCRSLEENDDS